VLLVGSVVWFGLWGLTLDRYVAFGTFDQWLAGATEPLAKSRVSTAINVIGVLDALGFAVLAVLLVRSSRRIRAT